MTLDQLVFLQNVASLVFVVCLGIGALYLVAGLIRPAWVSRKGRGSVVLRTLLLWATGLAVLGGTIGYTHSHPNGPHALSGYLDRYFAEECAKGADIPACNEQPAAAPAPAP